MHVVKSVRLTIVQKAFVRIPKYNITKVSCYFCLILLTAKLECDMCREVVEFFFSDLPEEIISCLRRQSTKVPLQIKAQFTPYYC